MWWVWDDNVPRIRSALCCGARVTLESRRRRHRTHSTTTLTITGRNFVWGSVLVAGAEGRKPQVRVAARARARRRAHDLLRVGRGRCGGKTTNLHLSSLTVEPDCSLENAKRCITLHVFAQSPGCTCALVREPRRESTARSGGGRHRETAPRTTKLNNHVSM